MAKDSHFFVFEKVLTREGWWSKITLRCGEVE